jgi:hypothetical protein
VATTTHGLLHFVVAGIGFFGIIAACLVFARVFQRSHRPGLAAYSLGAGLLFLAGFMGLASGSQSGFAILAFWIGLTAVWGWLAAVSVHYDRETRNRPATT